MNLFYKRHSLLTGSILFSTLLHISSCSVNTKFDDAEYRPVGASAPLNSEIHTLEETSPVINKAQDEQGDSSNIRYVKPGAGSSQTSTAKQPRKPETLTPVSKSFSGTHSKPSSESPSDNIITHSIKQLFNSRYGQPETIVKISRTVQIHCKQQSLRNSANNTSGFKLCRYQFPNFCGAHQFSVLSKNNSEILMYIDRKYQRNIIDTLSGNKQSAPGLWDEDDYVSSELLTISQLLNRHPGNSEELGWIMATSPNEKAQLGRSYYTAIEETSKCF